MSDRISHIRTGYFKLDHVRSV